jgi:transcription antitermination factor NusG
MGQTISEENRGIIFNAILHMGNWARVVEGPLHGESGQVILMDHTVGSASLEFMFNGHLEQIKVCLKEIEHIFWVGNTIKVVAGPYLGIEGHIIQMQQYVFNICQDISNEQECLDTKPFL